MRKPFLLDVTSRKGGLLVLGNSDIPSKYLRSFHIPGDTQAIPFEINLKQRKHQTSMMERSAKTVDD